MRVFRDTTRVLCRLCGYCIGIFAYFQKKKKKNTTVRAARERGPRDLAARLGDGRTDFLRPLWRLRFHRGHRTSTEEFLSIWAIVWFVSRVVESDALEPFGNSAVRPWLPISPTTVPAVMTAPVGGAGGQLDTYTCIGDWLSELWWDSIFAP